MQVLPETSDAIRRIPNKLDFCRRHDIPARSLYNLLNPEYSANRSTLMIVTMALQAEGLLRPAPRVARKKAAA